MKTIANITWEEKTGRCQVCFLLVASMDGPYCKATGNFVYPEGRTEVHPSCPYKIEVENHETI